MTSCEPDTIAAPTTRVAGRFMRRCRSARSHTCPRRGARRGFESELAPAEQATTSGPDDTASAESAGSTAAETAGPVDMAVPLLRLSAMKKPLRLRLPFGTLKVATYLQLSSAEHDGLVRTKRFGRYYFVWKPSGTASSSRDTA